MCFGNCSLCPLETASWSVFLSVAIYLSWTLLAFSPAQFLPIRAVDSDPYAKEALGPVTSISKGARLARRLPQQSECSAHAASAFHLAVVNIPQG